MKKIILLGLLGVVVLLFFVFELEQYLTLEYVKAQQQVLDQYYAENRLLTMVIRCEKGAMLSHRSLDFFQ